MPRDFQEIIKAGGLNALARVYRSPTNSNTLLISIGFPRENMPTFSDNTDPTTFWTGVCELIEDGIFMGGFEELFRLPQKAIRGTVPFGNSAQMV